jgi:hypothetical protein
MPLKAQQLLLATLLRKPLTLSRSNHLLILKEAAFGRFFYS